jgi:hypothetical protein
MYNIIEFGDRKFVLYRTIRDNGKIDVDLLKQYWRCDTSLKKNDIFHFCREIPEIEFEEIEENENQLCDTSSQREE